MDKFNRKYTLKVDNADLKTQTIIELPFTVEFNIVRNLFSSANQATFRIYNLSRKKADQIKFDKILQLGIRRRIIFNGGYEGNTPLMFDGNIREAWSVREGSNYVTQIEAYDGGFAIANAVSSRGPYSSTVTWTKILTDLISDLPGVSLGYISTQFNKSIGREKSFSGRTVQLLKEICDTFNIDNGFAYCLAENETLKSQLPVINAEQGLLNTPKKEDSFVEVQILLEPRLIVNQLVQLETLTGSASLNNQKYRVISVNHRGIISESMNGTAITSVSLLSGAGFQQVNKNG
jgi:hypothetical protein